MRVIEGLIPCRDTLDYLMDAGHIIGDPEAMYYRAADQKGKRPTYTLVLED